MSFVEKTLLRSPYSWYFVPQPTLIIIYLYRIMLW